MGKRQWILQGVGNLTEHFLRFVRKREGKMRPWGIKTLLAFREHARHSMRTRIALSLAGLSLACFFVLSLCGLVAYNFTISHIVRWHMDPILHMLVAASKDGEKAKIHSLAADLRILWYTDGDIPDEFRPAPGKEELNRIGDERYVLVSADMDGHVYAVVVKVEDLGSLQPWPAVRQAFWPRCFFPSGFREDL